MLRIAILIAWVVFHVDTKGQTTMNVREQLMAADREFSTCSQAIGRNKAFAEYAHPEVVMLVPNARPITGRTALIEHLSERSDTATSLTWEPLYACVADSGELGYTFGIWTLRPKKEAAGDKESKGTYVTIWKRDSRNKWRFVLDSGNTGLGLTR